VIFRDFINYSRERIALILRPAWKLMNDHLAVFTEIQGYGASLESIKNEDSDSEHE
jgi:hypothetical protein